MNTTRSSDIKTTSNMMSTSNLRTSTTSDLENLQAVLAEPRSHYFEDILCQTSLRAPNNFLEQP